MRLAVWWGVRVLLAALTSAVLVLPVVIAAGPDLDHPPKTSDVQKLVDTLLGIAEARSAFEEGDTLVVSVGDESWNGVFTGGAISMSPGFVRGATHFFSVDRSAMLSIINAYDAGNTMKLAVKRQYMTAESQRASVNTAIGAIARTPLDERLPTYDPKGGDEITFKGCTGTLGPRDDGQFFVKLCESRYIVDTIGGVSAKLPEEHFEDIGVKLKLTAKPHVSKPIIRPYVSVGPIPSYTSECEDHEKLCMFKYTKKYAKLKKSKLSRAFQGDDSE